MKSREDNIIGVFPNVEIYLTVTDIPKTESLEEQWTYFNEKYLRGNNFLISLLKQGLWEIVHSLKFKMCGKTMIYLRKPLKQLLKKNYESTLENSVTENNPSKWKQSRTALKIFLSLIAGKIYYWQSYQHYAAIILIRWINL